MQSTEHESAHSQTTAEDVVEGVKQAADGATGTVADANQGRTAKPVDEDPRDHLPGPDLAPYIPPAIDELPEPIVIGAE